MVLSKKEFIKKIKKKACSDPKRVVFIEAVDERILKATAQIEKEGIAKIILVGEKKRIMDKIRKLGLRLKSEIIDVESSDKINKYAEHLYELRKHKGLSLDEARKKIKNPIYYGTMMVEKGEADALIAGAAHPTGDTIRPALQIIKTEKGIKKVSGVFFMMHPKKMFLFADSAVNINPTSEELAEIALCTAKTAKEFGIKPKIAMLSFSTKGSTEHEMVDKVRKATTTAKKKEKGLLIEGEMQLDAAVDRDVCRRKYPKSKIKGDANVLIFPDLNSGNIAYKLIERLGGANAIGPIIQGLNKPVNDLSRGCSVQDIIDVTAISVVQAQNKR